MDSGELLTLLRVELSDDTSPPLVVDSVVVGFIDDAQKQFCRWTYGIEDARSFTLSLVNTAEWYAINARVLKIRSAYNATTGSDVPLIALEKMGVHGMSFRGAVGPVTALITGMEKGMLRAYPYPNQAQTINLNTFRLPVTIEAGDELEVSEQHHPHLLMWAKHRYYGVQDSEVYDKRKSADFREAFRMYCAEAKSEQDRLNRPVSTVTYGGI